jgi:amino acid transporter
MTTREVIDSLFGRPLATGEEESRERVGPLAGVSILGLDALASAAYGPEALLTVLLVLGASAVRHFAILTVLIVALLGILYISYRQTITAYPSGGGAYTVAKENLGTTASLFAAAALSLDYLLNVAVAISAGVGAIVSAVPALLPHTVLLCLGVLALLTLVNLRGFRATGVAFIAPAFLFVACMFLVMAVGVGQTIAHGLHPRPVVPPPAPPPAVVAAPSLWLLARAFSSGCTAMTGVEAVSNGVPIFRWPPEVGAHRTLTIIVGILAFLLVGIGVLCWAYGICATPPGQRGYESVLSQVTHATLGGGLPYALTMASIFVLLALSANTSFADFPRVCRMVAQDRFLPEAFVHRGRRFAFSYGIVVLALLSALLLVVFRGVTDRLIPLFAIGAFFAFTISQFGMVVHWRRHPGPHSKHSLVLNAVGAAATSLTMVVVLVSKFTEGAWISVLLVFGYLMLLRRVRAHYELVEQATAADLPLDVPPPPLLLAVVPLRRWNLLALKALRFATAIAPEVIAVQVLTGDGPFDDLSQRWEELVAAPAREHSMLAPKLVVLRSPYRELVKPLIDFVKDLAAKHPDRQVAVVLPRLVERRWRFYLLHNYTPSALRALLVYRGEPQIALVELPWYLADVAPEKRLLRGVLGSR